MIEKYFRDKIGAEAKDDRKPIKSAGKGYSWIARTFNYKK